MQNRPMHGGHPSRGNGLLVRLAVVLSIAFLIGMLVLLWLRWARVPEPTTAIVIYGDPSLAGAKVAVDPADEPEQHGRSIEVTLGHDDQYQIPIYRYPGRYRVSVTWQKHEVFNGYVTIDRLRGILIDLPTIVTIVGDKSLAGARVLLSARSWTTGGTLDEQGKYLLSIPLPPGQYTLSVTRGEERLADDEVTVAPHTPRRVDLHRGA